MSKKLNLTKDEKFNLGLELIKPIAEMILALLSAFALLRNEIFENGVPLWFIIVTTVFGGFIIAVLVCSIVYTINYKTEFRGSRETKTDRKISDHIKELVSLCKLSVKNFKKQEKKMVKHDINFKEAVRGQNKLVSIKEEEKSVRSSTTMKDYRDGIKESEKETHSSNLSKINMAKKQLISCILDIDHILLNTNELHKRIYFGKFVVNYSEDFITKMRAKIDLLGWTYALMGKRKACKDIIEEAQEELKNYESSLPVLNAYSSKEDIKLVYNFYKYKTRSYRHLAANPQIRRDADDGGAEYVAAAKQSFEELKRYVVFYDEGQRKDVLKNFYGIAFGTAEYAYDELKKYQKYEEHKTESIALECIEALNTLESSSEYLNKDNKEVEISLKELDSHRYVNVRLLRNKVFFLLRNIYGCNPNNEEIRAFISNFVDESRRETPVVKGNITEAAQVLAKAIYIDQAIESYVQQRVFETYKDVGELFNVYYGDELTKRR